MFHRILKAAGLSMLTIGICGLALADQASTDQETLPFNAKAGECYARVFVPPVYTTDSERVLVKEPSERLEVVPARYEWVEERILVKEASERLEIVPAKYRQAEEKILQPAEKKLVQVPAQYDWVEEKILVKPSQTIWKKGHGPVQRVDNATGEIMCLVEEPAVYKTVRKKVLKSAATTKEMEAPAEYKTVKKTMMVSPPTTRTVEIPAEYRTLRVKKEVAPATVKRFEIPAEYNTVSKTSLVTDGRIDWQRVVCETNSSPSLISRVQRALKSAGHNPGPIDGVLGGKTMRAIKDYQKTKGMPEGFLTHETVQALKVNIEG